MKKMDRFTKWYFDVILSISIYCILTLPHWLYITFEIGFIYPTGVCIILAFICGILGNTLGNILNK